MNKEATDKADGFLGKAGVFTMTTVDWDRPRAHPFGFHMMTEHGICFGVSDFKDAYERMVTNPNVEIMVTRSPEWLRYYDITKFIDDPSLEERTLESSPGLRAIYNEETGHRMTVFVLGDATADFYNVMTLTESLRL